MLIDLHTHIVPEEFPFKEGRSSGEAFPRMEPAGEGRAAMVVNGRRFRVFNEACWHHAKRAAALPSLGVDAQVVSPLPELLAYHLDPADGLDLARCLNEAIAALVRSDPSRFFGLGTVPLQDVELAVTELSALQALGLRGVEVASHVNGQSLGDDALRPFFREAARLDLSVFVHAYNPTFAPRLAHFPAEVAGPVTGFPIEAGLAGASLIWGGVLAELPGLRVGISHAGGVLAQLLARGEENYQHRDPVRALLPASPMDYARSMWFDDLAFTAANLRHVVDTFGASQVTVGTDYSGAGPTDPLPAAWLDGLGLSPAEREAIGSRNALRFLGL
jgi:aminocarboxymuconate-semialdehyde decarboxylase